MLKDKALNDLDRVAALENAGFKLDHEADITWYIFERLGGYYMDVGASAKIALGEVSPII